LIECNQSNGHCHVRERNLGVRYREECAMSDFVVRLDKIELPQEAQLRIANQIQGLVLKELATIDLGGEFTARFPREWLGLWLEKALDKNVPRLRVTT
jgi:hypothetical protein